MIDETIKMVIKATKRDVGEPKNPDIFLVENYQSIETLNNNSRNGGGLDIDEAGNSIILVMHRPSLSGICSTDSCKKLS